MVEQYFSHFVDIIFVVAACTAVKVVKVGKVVHLWVKYSWSELQPRIIYSQKIPAIIMLLL